jgi:hypothetical protein
VLPLRRFCPRWLNFPALVLGSLSPDAAYLFRRLQLERVSHETAGLVVFCLPATAILLALLYGLRDRLTNRLPPAYRRALGQQNWRPAGPIWVIVISILIGAATHLVWDSFTHPRGWAVEQFPALGTVIGSAFGRNVKICRVLWYASSFMGVALVYLAYRNAQKANPGTFMPQGWSWLEAILAAIVVFPIELVHELVRSAAGGAAVAVLSAMVVAGAIWRAQARTG